MGPGGERRPVQPVAYVYRHATDAAWIYVAGRSWHGPFPSEDAAVADAAQRGYRVARVGRTLPDRRRRPPSWGDL